MKLSEEIKIKIDLMNNDRNKGSLTIIKGFNDYYGYILPKVEQLEKENEQLKEKMYKQMSIAIDNGVIAVKLSAENEQLKQQNKLLICCENCIHEESDYSACDFCTNADEWESKKTIVDS